MKTKLNLIKELQLACLEYVEYWANENNKAHATEAHCIAETLDALCLVQGMLIRHLITAYQAKPELAIAQTLAALRKKES